MKTEGKYILKDKKVVACDDLIKWATWFETEDRVVKQETIGDVEISTVFIGIAYTTLEETEPLLFETMIFGGKEDGYQDRCTTWEQAEKMHLKAKKIVEELK